MGFIGRFNALFWANESNTLTIIAVTGVESTTDDDKAENFYYAYQISSREFKLKKKFCSETKMRKSNMG